METALYVTVLALSIGLWFAAIRAPLWLDETVSYWQIHGGFWQISSRRGLLFPAYSYILWLASKIFGTSEIGLRTPSILAMFGAAYLLYRAARELFKREIAVVATIVFCLHPVVAFASIDARPYAFAALAINATLYFLVRGRRSHSNRLAVLVGVAAASIVYFHFLLSVILPGLAVSFVLATAGDRRQAFRRLTLAALAFAVVFLPLIPGVLYLFRTSGAHVFDVSPTVSELVHTLAPSSLLWIFLLVALVAAATGKIDRTTRLDRWTVLLCVSTGLMPILILYGVSVVTPIHIFVGRYRMAGVSGLALCWALLVSRIDSRRLRLLFCIGSVLTALFQWSVSPTRDQHGYTWKYALQLAENNASADGAPVVICSDLPEADHMPMPTGSAIKDSTLFAPLTYYPLSVPVVPLPRALNAEAIRLGSEFLRNASVNQQRFLAIAYIPSYPTLNWLRQQASEMYDTHRLGDSNGIAILEFLPRAQHLRAHFEERTQTAEKP